VTLDHDDQRHFFSMRTNYKRTFRSAVPEARRETFDSISRASDFPDSPEWEIVFFSPNIGRLIDLLADNTVDVSLRLHAVIFFFASGQVDEASWTRLYSATSLFRLIRDCLETDDIESADLSMWCLGLILQGLPRDSTVLLFRELERHGFLEVVFGHFESEEVSPASRKIFFSLAEQLVTVEPDLGFVNRTFLTLECHLWSELQTRDLPLVSPALWSFLRSLHTPSSGPIREFLLAAFPVIISKIDAVTFSRDFSEPSRLDIIAIITSLCAEDPDASPELCGERFPVVLLRHVESVHDRSALEAIRFLVCFIQFAHDKSIIDPFFVAMVSIYRPAWVDLALRIAYVAFPSAEEEARLDSWVSCALEVLGITPPDFASAADSMADSSDVTWPRCMAAFVTRYQGDGFEMTNPLTPLPRCQSAPLDHTGPFPAVSLGQSAKLFYAVCLAAAPSWVSRPDPGVLVPLLCHLLASDTADQTQTNMLLVLLMRFVREFDAEQIDMWLDLLDEIHAGLATSSGLFPSLAERGCEMAQTLQDMEGQWRETRDGGNPGEPGENQ
jgi:hypothetical protein